MEVDSEQHDIAISLCPFYFIWCVILLVPMQWMEAEILRLSHLRDRASDLGRRKEYPLLYEFMSNFIIIML